MTRNTVMAGLVSLALMAAPALARADQTDSRLEGLFEQLKDAQTTREGALLEAAVWQIWSETEEDDAAFLYRRGLNAMSNDLPEDAIGFFSDAIKKAPEFAEAWNKRATVLYLMGDYQRSVADVEQTLALEPRHFGALAGLGLINLTLGRETAALRAFEAALKVHPQQPELRAKVKELRTKLGGKPT
jgi:tetratricopeptide (TPR) repeat protein